MAEAQIAQVRRFNRVAGERIGALQGDFLGLRRPIGEARLLWEVGLDGGDVRDLRARLGLDSGYASRLLRALEGDGLVNVSTGAHDARVRRVSLTARGRREWRELESRSDELASSVLAPLNDRQRGRLVDAMATVERLLTASMIATEVVSSGGADAREPPLPPLMTPPEVVSSGSADARYCINEYFRELNARFDTGFDPDRSMPAESLDVFLVARLRRRSVGCGGLKLQARAPAYLKRMWVSRELRGVGLGRRLL